MCVLLIEGDAALSERVSEKPKNSGYLCASVDDLSDGEYYGDISRFIGLIIRLWQRHMKVNRNRFFEYPSVEHSDKKRFLLFKERFWGEMSEAQRAAMSHIEESATLYG